MKSRITMWSTAATLLAALAMPVGMAAQDNPSPNHHRHHTYQLIDLEPWEDRPATAATMASGLTTSIIVEWLRGMRTPQLQIPILQTAMSLTAKLPTPFVGSTARSPIWAPCLG